MQNHLRASLPSESLRWPRLPPPSSLIGSAQILLSNFRLPRVRTCSHFCMFACLEGTYCHGTDPVQFYLPPTQTQLSIHRSSDLHIYPSYT